MFSYFFQEAGKDRKERLDDREKELFNNLIDKNNIDSDEVGKIMNQHDKDMEDYESTEYI